MGAGAGTLATAFILLTHPHEWPVSMKNEYWERAAKFVYDRCGTVAQRTSDGSDFNEYFMGQVQLLKEDKPPVKENLFSSPEG